jgi:hypothetical protein
MSKAIMPTWQWPMRSNPYPHPTVERPFKAAMPAFEPAFRKNAPLDITTPQDSNEITKGRNSSYAADSKNLL